MLRRRQMRLFGKNGLLLFARLQKFKKRIAQRTIILYNKNVFLSDRGPHCRATPLFWRRSGSFI